MQRHEDPYRIGHQMSKRRVYKVSMDAWDFVDREDEICLWLGHHVGNRTTVIEHFEDESHIYHGRWFVSTAETNGLATFCFLTPFDAEAFRMTWL